MDRRALLVAALGAGLAQPGGVLATPREPVAPAFGEVWEAFKAAHVRSGKVTDSYSGIVHTEGQGYSLLFATWANDQTTFRELWAFTQKMQRPDGLFSWRWEEGKVTDSNNATDGDIYIAWALLEASQRFADPKLKVEAVRILEATKLLRVKTRHGELLLPGLVGFVDPATAVVRANLSYWVFPAFEAFSQVHDAEFWKKLIETGLRIMGYSFFGRFQLPPDWLLLSDPVRPFGERPKFSYDAIRVPLFLAWSKQSEHPTLQRFKAFAKDSAFPAAVTLTSDAAVIEKAPVFALVGQAVERIGKEKTLTPGTAIPPDYYGKALMLLAQRALAS